jgi:lipoate-protein ligase A
MVYIALPEGKTRRLSFYLAMEEFVARNIDEDDCFFMWQVEPSVIFGRNQLIETEVNLDYCKRHNIKTYRRKSGGGCVYADINNIMFSYITKEENVNFTFNRYINMVALMLCKLGVDAKASGRNDIMIGDRKVSGNAFYHIPGRSIVHGTMLYDTDMQNMVGSITPNDVKLLSKGVKSVRQHIALLKDYIALNINEFKQYVRVNLCDRELMLTDDNIKEIEHIEEEYLSKEFIYGSNPRYKIIKKGRIENVGDLEVRMELKNNVIKEVNIMGDFFLIGDIDNKILKPLRNIPLTYEDISSALPETLDDIVLNLKKNDFIDLLINCQNE